MWLSHPGGPPSTINQIYMSGKSHHDRYFAKLLLGFASIIGSTLVIFYSIFEVAKDKDWYFWAIVAAFLLCSGIYFTLSAFVHKIKSDFSRRQKQREAQKTVSTDWPNCWVNIEALHTSLRSGKDYQNHSIHNLAHLILPVYVYKIRNKRSYNSCSWSLSVSMPIMQRTGFSWFCNYLWIFSYLVFAHVSDW